MKQVIYKRENGTVGVRHENEEPSMTEQQFERECDINYIMRQYEMTGELQVSNRRQGVYMDLVNAPDYHTAVHTVAMADQAFMSLDPKIRSRFKNDPSELVKFLADKANLDEAVKLGLCEAPKAPDVVAPVGAGVSAGKP